MEYKIEVFIRKNGGRGRTIYRNFHKPLVGSLKPGPTFEGVGVEFFM